MSFPTRIQTVAVLSLCLIHSSNSAIAVTYTFDGSADQTWEAANWNNGVSGQFAVESTGGDSGNPPTAGSYDYLNDDFFISNGTTVTSSERVTLQNGSITVNGGSSLTIDATGSFSALNIGFGGGPSSAVFDNATINLTGSGSSGRAMRMENGSTLNVTDSILNISSTGANDSIEVEDSSMITVTDSTLDMGYLRLDGGTAGLEFVSGAISVSNSNGLRSSNSFSGEFNWTGTAGLGTLSHTNLSSNDNNLAGKIAQGFFSIDGTRINPTLSNTTNWSVAANIDALNAELASLSVNNRFLQLSSAGGVQQLTLVQDAALTLQVFTDTGLTRIVNESGQTIDLYSYEISSSDAEQNGGSLDTANWLSIEDRNMTTFPAGNNDGTGWEEGGNPDEFAVTETFLLGASSLNDSDLLTLGNLFSVGETQDLEFKYLVPGEVAVRNGTVQYLSSTPLEADFNEDGTVDASDFARWRSGYGTLGTAQKSAGDADFDASATGTDFLVWQRQLGQSGGVPSAIAATAIPEPSSALLLLFATCGLGWIARRSKVSVLALVCLVLGITGSADAHATPNIVFIMADDLGWADVSTPRTNLGDPSDFYQTPTLERLASEGMAFTSAYANQNCAPTRTAILSGAYAPRSTNNVYQVGSLNRGGSSRLLVGPSQGLPNGDDALPTSTITHAETLQTAGYATAYVGKFHVTDSSANITANHGFDANFGGGTAGGPGNYHASGGVFGSSISSGLDPYASNYTQQYVDDNIKPYANGTSIAAIDALVGTSKHVTDASADATIDFMDTNKNGSFFVQYSSHAVHTPIGNTQARDDLLNKYQNLPPGSEDTNASFGALIEGLDQSVARIIDYLETTPDPNSPGQMLDENTLVVFYSDNGGRQNQSNNSILEGEKGELDEGGLRVPMIAWSGNSALVDGGTINDTPVMPIDFYKTFATLAGATLPGSQILDGEDLTGIIADNTATLGRDNHFWHLPGYLIDGGRNQRPQTVIRQGDWKLLYNYEDQSYELYDLANDLGETTNVAAANDALVDDLSDEIITWLDDVDAPLATLRSGSLDLFITGKAYANGVITNYAFETITINAGQEVPFIVDEAPADADTNMDGTVNILDWLDFKAGQNADMTGLTLGQSFLLGDIDHDLDNDINDLLAFRTSFEAIHGLGSFAALLSVPEPSSFALCLLAAGSLLTRRKR